VGPLILERDRAHAMSSKLHTFALGGCPRLLRWRVAAMPRAAPRGNWFPSLASSTSIDKCPLPLPAQLSFPRPPLPVKAKTNACERSDTQSLELSQMASKSRATNISRGYPLT